MSFDRPSSSSARGRVALGLGPLAAAVGLAACSDKLPTQSGNQQSGSRTVAASASAYIDTALAFEDTVFYFHSKVNFPAQRSAVRDSLTRTGSQGPGRDTAYFGPVQYSIDPFLRNAGDQHSDFFRPSEAPGVTNSPSDPRYLVSGLMLPASAGVTASSPVAYVWFPTYDGENDNGRADSTQTVIRALDQNSPCGWVLDLRFNPGGQPTAMMAGLNPLIGNTPVSATQHGFAGWVDYENATAYLYVQNGEAGAYDPSTGTKYPQVTASSPYTLKRPNSPVAILTGPITASAGEWLTLGFKGGPVPYRTFGEPTYGVTTVPYNHAFADHGYLNITAGIMEDRLGNLYGGKLTPDVNVVGPSYRSLTPTLAGTAPDTVVKGAVAWLQSRAECGGTVTAQAPSFSRNVSSAAPPATKGVTDLGKVSRYWIARAPRARALKVLGLVRQR